MRREMSPRTEILQRTYFGLLAVSIVLSGLLIYRHVAPPANEASAVVAVLAPIAVPATTRTANSLIKWGGQKR